MAIDYEIFEGKSLSSLFKDIYDNTEYNKKILIACFSISAELNDIKLVKDFFKLSS